MNELNSFKNIIDALSKGFVFVDTSINEMCYGEKIDLYITTSKKPKYMVANELGITERTMGEFTRPQGRTPSKTVRQLVDSNLSIYFLLNQENK